MGDPSAALTAFKTIPEETFQSSIMGILAYPEDLNSISPNFYAPYGWGMDWSCDPSECQAIGCIGGGHTTKNSNFVCDPRTGELIDIKLFEQIYRHKNEKPLSIGEIEDMPRVDQESYIAALNNIGPWVLTDDFFANTGCCGTTGNCNQSNCSSCSSCKGGSKYVPNVFDIRIETIRTSNPALQGNTSLKYAISVNGTQGNNIVLQRGVKYYFYIKTNISGVNNCDLNQDWMDTAVLFSRQPVGSSTAPMLNNTIPMPVGNAIWLNVPTNWPGVCYLVANRDDVAGVAVMTLPSGKR